MLHERKIEENKILYSYRFISFTLSLRNIISIQSYSSLIEKITRN